MNFNYTKDDYLKLNETEKAFIIKAFEDKKVEDVHLMRDANLNAQLSANEGKVRPIYEVKNNKTVSKEQFEEEELLKKRIIEAEKINGNAWAKHIYKKVRGC